MAYIKVIEPQEAEGELKEIYDGLIKSRGKIANVHTIQSLNPESIINHMDLYMTLMYGKSPLKRVLREMLGVIVSKANKCEYCQKHHLEAVQHYWKDEEKSRKFLKDFTKAGLSSTELMLCDFAYELTINPDVVNDKNYINPLKKAGLSDRAILDATMIIAYFNFVNRIVMSLGVYIEADTGNYKY
ncbi:MAG: peroxidase [Bacteroidetes bacterium]|nr:MAG: peroxidase [Bacteroidota bacterium]